MGRRSPALIGCLLLWGAARAGSSAPPPASPPAAALQQAPETSAAPPQLPEVQVFGVQPGPGLWKISKGDHILWLLGTLDHVPRRMTWRSREVETALSASEALLPGTPAISARLGPILLIRLYWQWRGLQKDPDRTRLRDWLSPQLYARFEALKTRYDPGDTHIEQLRPPFAALRLYQRALDAAGLTRTNEIEQAVLRLAQQRRVPIERARLRVDDPLGTLKQVRSLSPADETNCLATTVARLESDLPAMQQRARAWAVGDVQRLRELPYPDQVEACVNELSAVPQVRALVDSATRSWMAAVQASLQQHRVSFAMRPIYQLLANDGPLAQLRAKGYRVEGPQ